MYKKIVPIDKKAQLISEFSNELENIIKNAYLENKKKDRARARLLWLTAILFLSLIILRPTIFGAVENQISAYVQDL